MSIPGPKDVQRRELSNGIVVLVRENHASPAVVIKGYLRVGAYDERPERAGLASFTADALMRGTVDRTFEEVYESLEAVGASVGVGAGTHFTGFGTKSLVEDLPLALDVLADVLRHPTFPGEEVEKLRGEILTDLEERGHDTRRMANLAFSELVYPEDHPYHYSNSGYVDTVSQLGRDDLVTFYRHGYGPDGMVVAVVGAVDAEQAFEQLEAAFGDWEGPTYEREPLPELSPIREVRQQDVLIPGKTQADIVLGYPGPARTSPDYLEAAVCNTILGVFGLMGRLGDKVRDELGLAYYSYSIVSGGPGPGPWRVVAGVNPRSVEQAIESIRDEIRRMCEEPVSEAELQDTQAFITGSLPLRLETNEGVSRVLLDIERYDLGLDYLQRYADLINGITRQEVQEVAQRWLDPEAYAVAIAGPQREA
jgi:zinc protease